MKPKFDRFILALIIVVVIAYLFPQWGSKESPLPLGLISSIGISLIFFFYGLKLSAEKIRMGMRNWKLHLLVQLTTFLIFPLIVIAFYPFFQSEDGQVIWLSFLFLAAVPSTVSSSVVMVAMARGNLPGAIFNASISGLIGILVTPLWMGLFLQSGETDYHIGSVYIKLISEILLPVIVGIVLQRYWGGFALRYSRQLSRFDKSVILLIVYKSFAQSFEDRIFSSVGMADLLLISLAVIVLFYFAYYLTGFLSKFLGFSFEDRITAQFCGAKKSLVHGMVFANILFPASFPTGIILLPLMLYHAFQIFVISAIATRLSKLSG